MAKELLEQKAYVNAKSKVSLPILSITYTLFTPKLLCLAGVNGTLLVASFTTHSSAMLRLKQAVEACVNAIKSKVNLSILRSHFNDDLSKTILIPLTNFGSLLRKALSIASSSKLFL